MTTYQLNSNIQELEAESRNEINNFTAGALEMLRQMNLKSIGVEEKTVNGEIIVILHGVQPDAGHRDFFKPES